MLIFFYFTPFVLEKETVEGFNVFKSSKQLAPAVDKEKEKVEDGPSKAKKELNKQIEVLFLPSLCFSHSRCHSYACLYLLDLLL